MAKSYPYIIYHVKIENQVQELGFSDVNKSGYYCVFWWKQIPLGHLYIEKDESVNSDNFQQKVLSVIKPAIEFYAAKRSITVEYENLFLKKDPLFLKMMEDLFSSFVPTVFPERVDISVVICTRNRSDSLKACLSSMYQQVCMPKEIIIVDNAPSDDTTLKVVENFKDVVYCIEPKPGLSIARNTGIKKAKYSIIAWIDDDIKVHSLWTYRIWESFLTPSVTAITGLVIASCLDTESQQIFEKDWSFNRGYLDKVYDSSFCKIKSVIPAVWEIGAGANMAFRANVFKEVGYFDETLGAGASGCSEDSEIWFRIISDKRFTIHYNPRAVVYHGHRQEIAALHKQLHSYMQGHVVAALIQHEQNRSLGYKKYVFKDLPKYYLLLLRQGFPYYRFRYQTLLSEIRGIISGILFFRKNKAISVLNQKSLL